MEDVGQALEFAVDVADVPLTLKATHAVQSETVVQGLTAALSA